MPIDRSVSLLLVTLTETLRETLRVCLRTEYLKTATPVRSRSSKKGKGVPSRNDKLYWSGRKDIGERNTKEYKTKKKKTSQRNESER